MIFFLLSALATTPAPPPFPALLVFVRVSAMRPRLLQWVLFFGESSGFFLKALAFAFVLFVLMDEISCCYDLETPEENHLGISFLNLMRFFDLVVVMRVVL